MNKGNGKAVDYKPAFSLRAMRAFGMLLGLFFVVGPFLAWLTHPQKVTRDLMFASTGTGIGLLLMWLLSAVIGCAFWEISRKNSLPPTVASWLRVNDDRGTAEKGISTLDVILVAMGAALQLAIYGLWFFVLKLSPPLGIPYVMWGATSIVLSAIPIRLAKEGYRLLALKWELFSIALGVMILIVTTSWRMTI